MIRRCMLVLSMVLIGSTSAFAQKLAVESFDKSFNSASKRIGSAISLVNAGCRPSECEFGAVPDLRVVVNGDDGNTNIESVSAYLPRDAGDKARSRRSAVTATAVAATLIAVFNPAVPPKKRGVAVMALLDGATGSAKRGEVDLDGVNYVLSATQADNLRLYVTR